MSIYVVTQEKKEDNTNVDVSVQNVSANNTQNNVTPEVKDNNIIVNNQIVTPQEIVKSTTISDEDKAKELAKQKWGGSDGVYFSIDNMNSDETYVVSVRDSATTKVLEWYTVNIKSGSVTN